MLGVGVAVLIEFLHKATKSSDMEKILGVQMLGMIPEIEVAEKEKTAISHRRYNFL